MKDIKMIDVTASIINKIGYDAKTKTLAVEFKGTGIYLYSEVPATIFDELLKAESVGKYFTATIKDKFEFTKVK